MSALSNTHAATLLNQSLRSGTYYLGLFLSSPGVTNNGVEVTGGGYKRKQIAFTAPTLSDGKEQVSNNADVDFGTVSADIGTVSYWGIYDAVSNGNLLWFGAFTRARSIMAGDAIVVKAGAITCKLS